MTLFLVQHGKAKPETEDPERSLTEQGAEVVGRMADWAAQVGLAVDQIQHSGKRRAEQTATIFPSARELVRENKRNSQDRVDAFPVDGALGWRLRLPD